MDNDMDNQQGKIDLAWLAGFLDGEGSLHASRQYTKGLKQERYCPVLKVSNTDYNLLV